MHAHCNNTHFNKRGSAIIGVIIAAALVTALGVAVQEIAKSNLQILKVARIRTFISTAEMQIRAQLAHPASYEACDAKVGAKSCRIRTSVLQKFRQMPVPGTACSTVESNCGLVLMSNNSGKAEPINFSVPYENGVVNTARETVDYAFFLRYSGKDVTISDTPVTAAVSFDLLQDSELDCARIDPSKPFFSGFDSAGKASCRALPADCPLGEFVNKVNSSTMQTSCNNIPSADIQCSLSQFIANFSWKDGNFFDVSCQERRDPFDVFSMGPPATIPLPEPTPTPTPTPKPSPTVAPSPTPIVDCSQSCAGTCASSETCAPTKCQTSELVNLYNQSVTHVSAPITDFAWHCRDNAVNYAQMMAGEGPTRFKNTCAVRWCSKIYNVPYNAVGFVTSQIEMNSTGGYLESQTLQIQCRTNKLNSSNNSCTEIINNKQPLVWFAVSYSDANSCGSSPEEAMGNYNSDTTRNACATNFCLSKNDGYKRGFLTEISSTGKSIVCSRAD